MNIFGGLAEKIGIAYVGREIHAAAEGKRGPTWQHRYQAAAAAASYTGFVFGVGALIAEHLGAHDVAVWIGTLAGIGIGTGLVNSAYQTLTPKFVVESRFYAYLASHSGTLASIFATLAWALDQPAVCTYLDSTHLHCATAQMVFGLLALLGVSLRVLDPAWKKTPPLFGPAVTGQRVQIP